MHYDCTDYEHKGIRIVEVCKVTPQAGNDLSGIIGNGGSSGSSIDFNSEFRVNKDNDLWGENFTQAGSATYDNVKRNVIINCTKSLEPPAIASRGSYTSFNIHAGRRTVATFGGIWDAGGDSNVWEAKAGIFDSTEVKNVGAAGSGAYVKYLYDEGEGWFLGLKSGYSGVEQLAETPRTSWNIDKLDGTGPTEINITLDKDKEHYFRIEIANDATQYVLFYYMYNGTPIPIHEFKLNQETKFVLTENIPLMWEVTNYKLGTTHRTVQCGSNVVSFGGRGQFNKIGTVLVETPNQVQTSGGNEEFFLAIRCTNTSRLTTFIERVFFDAQGNTPYQFFWKMYLRRNPATQIGNTYQSVYGTGAERSLGFDAVQYNAFLLNNPNNLIIASGIWDRAAQFTPFSTAHGVSMGHAPSGETDELILTVTRTDSVDNKDVWGGLELYQYS